MYRVFFLIFSMLSITCAEAQVLTLDSCRAMALRSNKQMSIAKVKKAIAENTRKAAKTKYLPHVDIAGGYVYNSRSISLLNDDTKANLGSLGTGTMQRIQPGINNITAALSGDITQAIQKMAALDIISPAEAKALLQALQQTGTHLGQLGQNLASNIALLGDNLGNSILDAFNTDTHHIFTATATLTQPIYMGGAITASNKMAEIAETMADRNIEAKEHDILNNIDNAYWMVVSLKHKQRLAEAYLNLVKKLDSDVDKMIANGVATRADGLKVEVAVNEAEMTKAKVDNGLTLAKMFLCQQCGMNIDTPITLADEDKKELTSELSGEYDVALAKENRPELKLLSQAIELTRQQTKLARAAYMPQVALMTGAVFSNPSVYNGFERKFKGNFTAGVMVRVPILDWGETMYKVRASKGATTMAILQQEEAEEMIELQVNQCTFKVRESNKNLITAKKNILHAEENLRCANLGFQEGVMQTSDVMAAQTAWLQAQTQMIDAEIDVKLSEAALKKAVGIF